MRDCLLAPRVESYLCCLLNQWEAWLGVVKDETAGVCRPCLDCREGAVVLKKAAAYEVKPREPRPPKGTWGKYAAEMGRP